MAITVTSAPLVRSAPSVGRRNRKPQHPFQLRTRPYAIQPFLLAPVLPGETMTNLLLQSRVVTDPIKNPLIGWWKEYYIFYVKLRDLDYRDEFTAMMLDPDWSKANVVGNPNGDWNNTAHGLHSDQGNGRINYVGMCLDRVVEEYFRDEDEAKNVAMTGNTYQASINQESWLESAKLEAIEIPQDEQLPGEYPVIPDNVPPGFEDHFAQWQAMRSLKLTEATFEDFLRSYGVRVPKQDREDRHIPELLRYTRDWTYPTNTINPADGTPSSACSWSIAERADKDRFFSEPGFIFGVTVTRPKVYLGRQYNQLAAHMDSALSWLPAVLWDDPFTSLRKFEVAGDAGPLSTSGGYNPGEDYWVDMKDLFLYGDQFSNFKLWEEDTSNYVNLPTGPGGGGEEVEGVWNKKYALAADIDRLFKTGNRLVREDGVVSLTIQGRVVETT